jgi:TRAP-type C4-dicarboxylate transport system substrate-binding protein
MRAGALILLGAMLLAPTTTPAVVMKMATVAPEQSTWMRVMRECQEELRQSTNGEVELRLYPGGVSGDEKDVLRKMRFGQLAAGGFTGFGLGELVPWVRALELPFLMESPDDAAAALSAVRDTLEAVFLERGFEVLGWSAVGMVYIFSKEPITGLSELRKARVWLWEGDRLARKLFEEARASPIQVALPDVITSLETGLLDAVYASPLAALALQWFTKVNYMTDLPLTHSIGAVVVSRRFMEELSEPTGSIVRDIFRAHLARLDTLARRDQLEALAAVEDAGVQLASVPPSEREAFRRLGRSVRQALAGKMLPPWLMETVEQAVKASHRKGL